MDDRLPEYVAARLKDPLPGRPAQAMFEPELCFGRHFGIPGFRARQAGVFVLLFPADGQWHLPLTIRPQHMQLHPGQISLPGGTANPGEVGPQSALRELHEELGVPDNAVEVLGRLSPLYLFASDFVVTPWIGVVRHRPVWRPSAEEVAEVLEVPLFHLIEPSSRGRHIRRQGGVEISAPHFGWQGERIWGVTSMILGELAAIVRQIEGLGTGG